MEWMDDAFDKMLRDEDWIKRGGCQNDRPGQAAHTHAHETLWIGMSERGSQTGCTL
jgi:hypothetical protein